MEVKDAIIAIRKGLELSQRKFAKLIGVAQPTVFKWESGAMKPRWETIAVINDTAKKNKIKARIKLE